MLCNKPGTTRFSRRSAVADFVWLHDLKNDECLQLLGEHPPQPGETGTYQLVVNQGLLGSVLCLGLEPEGNDSRKALIAAYRDRFNRLPENHPMEGEVLDLLPGLAAALAVSEARGDALEAGLYLIISENAEPEKTAVLLQDLRFHATSVEVAVSRREGRPVYLFQVLDDPHRKSTFRSLLEADGLQQAQVLKGHEQGRTRLYLDADASVHPEHMGRFAELVEHCHGGRRPTFAFLQGTPGRFYDLSDLPFQDALQLGKTESQLGRIRVETLQADPQTMVAFRDALAGLEPKVGYRLALRTTRFRENVALERLRLRERLAEIEYRLAYLDSLAQARPILLRFEPTALRTLAEVLKDLPVALLRDGRLRYAYRGDTNRPAGRHYILMEPGTGQTTQWDPLLDAWNRHAVRFQLDPTWSRYYADQGNQAWVFVPRGHGLFPAMHSQDPKQMDHYLRGTFSRRMKDDEPLPEQPFYIFEHGEDDQLDISVMDYQAFQPLYLQLEWINDHLNLLKHIPAERFVGAMAKGVTRQEMARYLTQEAETAERDFEHAVLTTNQSMAEKIRDLSKILDERLEQTAKATFHAARELGRMERELERITKLRDEIKEEKNETKEDVRKLRLSELQLEGEIEEIDKRLQLAVRKRKNAAEHIENECRELRELHDELRKRFIRMLRMR